MKRLISMLSLSVIVSLLIPFLAFAHSGRTDANGGHYNRKTGEYHYHGGGPARAAAPAKSLNSQSGSQSVPSSTSSGAKVQGSGKTDQVETTVYVTRTGAKYHSAGCSYLRNSSIPMKLSEASRKYTPCSRCNPPKPVKQTSSGVNGNENMRIDQKKTGVWTDADGTTQVNIKGSGGTGDSSASQATRPNETAVGSTATGKTVYEGPRGGHYHYSASGKKVYERRK